MICILYIRNKFIEISFNFFGNFFIVIDMVEVFEVVFFSVESVFNRKFNMMNIVLLEI